MPHIKKDRPGGDSFGHEWPAAGAVVEVTVEQASALLAIKDGGFSEVAPPAVDEPEDTPASEPQQAEVSEAPKPRRTRTPKAKAEPEADQLIEE